MLPRCDERLGQRDVDVHRTAMRFEGRTHGIGNDLTQSSLVEALDIDEGANIGSEELALIDRLVGAGPAHRPGSVRGDSDEGHSGVCGLNYGGVQIDRSGARRRNHGHGVARHPREAEGEVRRAALVDPHVQSHMPLTFGIRERERDGRGPRSGREDHVAHPAGDQLLDEGNSQAG
jgi:hypothetical protein